MNDKNWPAWYNGPNGESRIFNSADEVPSGWTTGAEKRSAGKAAPPPAPSPPPAAKATETADIDAHGHPWSADLHAASKSKTTAGLWRMKVGKSRPDPKPGYPLDL